MALRRAVFARDRYRCRTCGGAGRLECDHIRPLWKGGDPWKLANLQSLCRGCHIEKTRAEAPVRELPPEVKKWRERLERIASG